jgi:hypothetical protein
MSAEKAAKIAAKKREEDNTPIERVWIDELGREHPWMYEGNPALWKDAATGADWEDD